jgi:hypothetical protein
MSEMIAEILSQVLLEMIMALFSVAGVWLVSILAKQEKLKNIAVATAEVVDTAKQTAAALQQEFVLGWKAANADGKLTEDEVKKLSVMLLEKTLNKLSAPAMKVLEAAGKDITAIIRDAAEAWVLDMKSW